MRRSDFCVDVNSPVGSEVVSVAASVFHDEAPTSRFLVGISGAGYSREYWSPQALDTSYSFAAAMVARGFGVITIDTIGTGGSGRLRDGDVISLEVAADFHARSLDVIRSRVGAGSLVPELPASPGASYIGVGHSLGGAMIVMQQAGDAPFDAVALLGFTTSSVSKTYEPHEREESLTPAERLEWAREHIPSRRWGSSWNELPVYFGLDRARARRWHHFADVPESVIEAEESCTTTAIPRSLMLQAMLPGATSPYAERIGCPVLLCFGEIDAPLNPRAEPLAYPGSDDITLVRLRGSGHCHNFSTPRAHLWDRLATWAGTAT
jgi:alpha-beta hydrolase superfamily lysophospholipase